MFTKKTFFFFIHLRRKCGAYGVCEDGQKKCLPLAVGGSVD